MTTSSTYGGRMRVRSLSIRAVVAWSMLMLAVSGRDRDQRDRGDVPGWVMITVMTAALVVAILIPFRRAIVAAVTKALSDVTGA
jgi:hypothetical protein